MSSRSLRACMVCSIILQGTQFQREGCPNCEEFLEMRGSQEAVLDCTSAVFEGMITVNDVERSWVARWQRLNNVDSNSRNYKPGVYAVKVVGILPDDYVNAAENAGVKYIPRDGTAATDDQ